VSKVIIRERSRWLQVQRGRHGEHGAEDRTEGEGNELLFFFERESSISS
jgi:hypothetical protein